MKIFILGNYTTVFLKNELEKNIKKLNFDCQIKNADYDSIDFNILDSNSDLYNFNPDILIWHESTLKIRDIFYNVSELEKATFSENYLNKLNNYLNILFTKLPRCRVVYANHTLLFNDKIYGNFGLKIESSWQYQIIKLNYLLNNLALSSSNLFLVDSSKPIYNGHFETINFSLYINADLHFTLDYFDFLSKQYVNIILSLFGKSKKCIILDLDNTLWGGVIGDDGLNGIEIGDFGIGKAYSKLQTWLKELSNRGIILVVCSKNNEDIAKEPFIKHNEMILKLDDIALFVANWNNKADNIRYIQNQLNISFDSMVFIDDNPAEREIVTKYLPDILVPDLPKDPSEYLPFLIDLNLFETINFSKNDSLRTKQYIDNFKRNLHLANLTNMDEYLDSLRMKILVQSFNENNIDRISQLTLRSNQFNLTTKRYTVSDIRSLINNPNYITYSVNLSDKFGDYGLISLVILKKQDKIVTIDTWLMSCRVLKRTVEHFLMNHIVSELIENDYEELEGEYIPTEKNSLVFDLLSDLGMEPIQYNQNLYKLKLKNYNQLKSFINYE